MAFRTLLYQEYRNYIYICQKGCPRNMSAEYGTSYKEISQAYVLDSGVARPGPGLWLTRNADLQMKLAVPPVCAGGFLIGGIFFL